MKKNFWPIKPVIYLLSLVALLFALITAVYDIKVFYIELAVVAVAISYSVYKMIRVKKETYLFLQKISSKLGSAQKDTLSSFPMPAMVTGANNEIIWYNDLFRDNVLKGNDLFGVDASKVFGQISKEEIMIPGGTDISYNDRDYTVYGTVSEENDIKLTIYYFVDDTELKHNSTEYFESRPSVALILIDNFEELLENARESQKAQITMDIERILEDFIGQTNGFMRKLDRSRFIAIIEERHIKRIIEGRFSVLDKVREVVSGDNNMQATLSIGIGRGAKTLSENEHMARQALDMALGRGGDQAAVKTANGYEFYGGVSKGIEKRTKVKTRIVATALTELIDTSDNVIVMGHRFGDLDCLGASVGLVKGIRQLNKQCIIAVDKQRNLATPLIDRLVENGLGDIFVEPVHVLPLITKKTLLIIVDTHVPNFLESTEIYNQCKNVVVIDHHRKMVGHIDNAVIFYHEPFASSASEMVAELLQYFGDQCRISRFEAEALLAGIMLDTKNFVIKTGVRTFEAAAFLKRMGADTVEVRKLFASSMESYQRKARLVAAAEVYRRCAIAISSQQGEDMRIVAPQAADELLGISDVDASFVLYETENDISVSARSMGKLNVQLIAEKLGGGGHLTMAGAQLKDISLENARQLLLEVIDEYYNSLNADKK